MIISQEHIDFKAETDVSVPYLYAHDTLEQMLICKLQFTTANYRKEAWLIAWNINSSGESGPPSIPLNFIIT